MSKTGQWVYSMQEDAWEMTREDFIAKHGPQNAVSYTHLTLPTTPYV